MELIPDTRTGWNKRPFSHAPQSGCAAQNGEDSDTARKAARAPRPSKRRRPASRPHCLFPGCTRALRQSWTQEENCPDNFLPALRHIPLSGQVPPSSPLPLYTVLTARFPRAEGADIPAQNPPAPAPCGEQGPPTLRNRKSGIPRALFSAARPAYPDSHSTELKSAYPLTSVFTFLFYYFTYA